MTNSINVNIKVINQDAVVPKYGTDQAACFDLHATSEAAVLPQNGSKFIGTGLTFEIPKGYVMLVFSRSGHGFKNDIRLCNSVGVIDSDYRGEVMVKLHNDGQSEYQVAKGERIAQAMIIPHPPVTFSVVENLSETIRGEGGFGSTGK